MGRGLRRWLVAGVCCGTLLLAQLFGTDAAQAQIKAPQAPQLGSDEAVAEGAEDRAEALSESDTASEDLSRPEPNAMADPDQRAQYVKFHRELLQRFPDRLGIVSVTDSGDGLVVPVVGLTEAERGALAADAAARSLNLLPVPAVVSAAELDEVSSQAVKLLEARDATGWGVGTIGDEAIVEVTLAPKADDAAAIRDDLTAMAEGLAVNLRSSERSIAAKDLLRVVEGEDVDTAELRDEAPPRGAKWIDVGGANCTLGYVTQSSGGTYYGTSAGHCAGSDVTGDSVKNNSSSGTPGSTTYGVVNGNYWHDYGTDVLRFPLSGYDGSPRVYTSGDTYKLVAGVVPDSGQFNDDDVCGAGWGMHYNEGLNTKCGDIEILNYTANTSGITITDLNCYERKAWGGDSGGPVYYVRASDGRALAAGIIKLNHHTGPPDHDYTCYTLSDNLESHTNTSIVIVK